MDKKTLLPLFGLALMGLVLILFPGQTVQWLCRALGIGLMVVGVCELLNIRNKKSTDNTVRIILTVLSVIAGLWIYLRATQFASILPVLLGIVLVVIGATMLFRAKHSIMGKDRVSLAMPLVTVIAGILLLINPFGAVKVVAVIAGIALLYSSVTGIMQYLRQKN